MKIGDKVRFLNDVGGGKVTGFRPGGIVLVEDEDGFDMPVPQNEVVVIEETAPAKATPAKAAPAKAAPAKAAPAPPSVGKGKAEPKEQQSLDGREYLQSKTVNKAAEESETDEQLEARVVRLEMALHKTETTIQKLEDMVQKLEKAMQDMNARAQKSEANLSLLEAKFNLQKNERSMAKKPQPQPQPLPQPKPTASDIKTLDIL